MSTKLTNPKDAVGIRKVPFSTVSAQVIAEMGLGMLEGARKYGRHNYRIAGVRASVYYDATLRHLMAWWEGEDTDKGSGLNHVTKALTALAVLRDAMLNEMWTDDRPPSLANQNWIEEYNKKASEIIDKYPESVPAYTIHSKKLHDVINSSDAPATSDIFLKDIGAPESLADRIETPSTRSIVEPNPIEENY